MNRSRRPSGSPLVDAPPEGRPGNLAAGARAAFTVLELLVVATILSILASLLLPAFARARSSAEGTRCLGNARHLILGWLLYADDHDGRLPPNIPWKSPGWVSGVLNFDNKDADNTNTLLLVDARSAKLGPYVTGPEVFKCPTDRSTVLWGTRRVARVRSVSMNAMVGLENVDQTLPANWEWLAYRSLAQITSPSPDHLWVTMDEHPDSLDDASFEVDLAQRGAGAYFFSWPASFHHEGASVTFADGHTESHRWTDSRTKHELKYCGCLSSYAKGGFFTKCPGNPDLAWIQERSSGRAR